MYRRSMAALDSCALVSTGSKVCFIIKLNRCKVLDICCKQAVFSSFLISKMVSTTNNYVYYVFMPQTNKKITPLTKLTY